MYKNGIVYNWDLQIVHYEYREINKNRSNPMYRLNKDCKDHNKRFTTYIII